MRKRAIRESDARRPNHARGRNIRCSLVGDASAGDGMASLRFLFAAFIETSRLAPLDFAPAR